MNATTNTTVMKNQENLKWEPMLPELGKDSPVYAALRENRETGETTIVIEFPTAIHIPRHTHEKGETHYLLRGSHIFENSDTGERYDIRENGYFYLPGHIAHEAWVPAGSKAMIVLEDGWKVNWLNGGPTVNDLGKGTPKV